MMKINCDEESHLVHRVALNQGKKRLMAWRTAGKTAQESYFFVLFICTRGYFFHYFLTEWKGRKEGRREGQREIDVRDTLIGCLLLTP